MEAYIRQKRATPGMVQANDIQIMRPSSSVRRGSSGGGVGGGGRENYAYDGPMQFMMSPNNPDQIITDITPDSNSSEGIKSNCIVCIQ